MKTPGELKQALVDFIKHLYHADETSSAVVHWWWFKKLVDWLYTPTRVIIYLFNYVPPFSWIYHAFEGIFGKNGYIGVGSVAGLYIAIYGVAQSSNQDELDRQERAMAKHEAAMKQTDAREKMHGMKGLVKLSGEAIQLKPVFKCPIKYGDCETYWFELSQYRHDIMAEELGHFYTRCHKEQDCGQPTLPTSSQLFNLEYLNEDRNYIGYNDFRRLLPYILDDNYLLTYRPSFISLQLYQTITPTLDLRNLEFKQLDISRWPLYHSELRGTLFNGVKGEAVNMRRSVYRELQMADTNLTAWAVDGSLVYSSRFTRSRLNVAPLTQGVSFVKSIFANSHIEFERLRDVSFADSSLRDTSITLASVNTCADPADIDFDAQIIPVNDLLQLYQDQGEAIATEAWRSKLSCNLILPDKRQCRFIARNRCLSDNFQMIETTGLNLTGSHRI